MDEIKDLENQKLDIEKRLRKLKEKQFPKLIPNKQRNYTSLEQLLERYIQGLKNDEPIGDASIYIYEKVIETFFGDIWKWINEHPE